MFNFDKTKRKRKKEGKEKELRRRGIEHQLEEGFVLGPYVRSRLTGACLIFFKFYAKEESARTINYLECSKKQNALINGCISKVNILTATYCKIFSW